MDATPETIYYKRSHFVTHLPVSFRYSPTHFWLAEQDQGHWRIGMTRFATRMLGEMVDCGFESEEGAPVEPGKIVGWVEGFKAITDLYCVAEGVFSGVNPALKDNISLLGKDCYGAGWLYMVRGTPDPNCVDVHGYRSILDKTIDRILEKERSDETK
jgi:glycine cleavage system H protein